MPVPAEIADENNAGGEGTVLIAPVILNIELEKTADSKLGFNIVGGSDSQHIPGHHGIFVTKLQAEGAARQDGRIKEGDRIISVNGRSLENVTHEEAVRTFRTVKGKVLLQLESGGERRILEEPSFTLATCTRAEMITVSGSETNMKSGESEQKEEQEKPQTSKPSSSSGFLGSKVPPTPPPSKASLKDLDEEETTEAKPMSNGGAQLTKEKQEQQPERFLVGTGSKAASGGFRSPSPFGSRGAKFEIGDPVDTPKTMSNAPSTTSLVDDVPATPKRPILSGEVGSSWSGWVPEVAYVVLGCTAIVAVGYFAYRRFSK